MGVWGGFTVSHNQIISILHLKYSKYGIDSGGIYFTDNIILRIINLQITRT